MYCCWHCIVLYCVLEVSAMSFPEAYTELLSETQHQSLEIYCVQSVLVCPHATTFMSEELNKNVPNFPSHYLFLNVDFYKTCLSVKYFLQILHIVVILLSIVVFCFVFFVLFCVYEFNLSFNFSKLRKYLWVLYFSSPLSRPQWSTFQVLFLYFISSVFFLLVHLMCWVDHQIFTVLSCTHFSSTCHWKRLFLLSSHYIQQPCLLF